MLPDEISFEEGTFIEPLACVIRGQRVAGLKPGQTVLVIGSGISGILHIALARALGAGRIIATDISEYRLKMAKKFGADVTIDAREDVPACVRKANDGRLADLVIICTGATPAFEQALKSVDSGGTVQFFAPTEPGINLSVPVNDFWRNGITLMPSYGAAPQDLTVAIDLLRSRRINVKDMITHRLSLAAAAKGFQLVASAGESLKPVINPW